MSPFDACVILNFKFNFRAERCLEVERYLEFVRK